MKKVEEKFYCDICDKEIRVGNNVAYPVITMSENCLGEYYLSSEVMDLCRECSKKVLKIQTIRGEFDEVKYAIRDEQDLPVVELPLKDAEIYSIKEDDQQRERAK